MAQSDNILSQNQIEPVSQEMLMDVYDMKNIDEITATDGTEEMLKTLMQNKGALETYANLINAEDKAQIPFHEDMGPINSTILKCMDGAFVIDPAKINPMGVSTVKLTKHAIQSMTQR